MKKNFFLYRFPLFEVLQSEFINIKLSKVTPIYDLILIFEIFIILEIS